MNLRLLLKTLSPTALAITLGIIVAPESAQASNSFSTETVATAQPTLLLNSSNKEMIWTEKSETNIANESQNNSATVIASGETESTSIKIAGEVKISSYSATETESISIPVTVENNSNNAVENSINIPVVPAVTKTNKDHNPVVTLDHPDSTNFVRNNSSQAETNLVSQQVKIIDPASKNSKQPTSSNEELLSSVPIPIQHYDPTTSPSVESLIKPELPSIDSPEAYLPRESNTVNGYIWPAKGVFTSGYGPRWGRMHRGIDIAAPVGTPIFAAADGQVIFSGWNSGGFGNLVKIKHFDGSITLYAHNSKNLVRNGEWVQQGQQISKMGSTGRSTGPHLHFEIHPKGQGAVNPVALLPKR